jgi:uncharacterized RDD family membrane protein YckC
MRAHRIFAYIIDSILLGVLTSLVCFIIGLDITMLFVRETGIRILFSPVSIVAFVVSTAYFLTDVLRNGSPGKKILGLRVSVTTPGLGPAVTRALVKVFSINIIIGIILFFFGDAHSSLHDKAAGTRVDKKMVTA